MVSFLSLTSGSKNLIVVLFASLLSSLRLSSDLVSLLFSQPLLKVLSSLPALALFLMFCMKISIFLLRLSFIQTGLVFYNSWLQQWKCELWATISKTFQNNCIRWQLTSDWQLEEKRGESVDVTLMIVEYMFYAKRKGLWSVCLFFTKLTLIA